MMAARVSQGAPGDQWEVRVVTSCVTTRDGEMGRPITPALGEEAEGESEAEEVPPVVRPPAKRNSQDVITAAGRRSRRTSS